MRVFYILYVSRDEGMCSRDEGILHFVFVPGMRVFYILYVSRDEGMCSRDEGILHFVCVQG